MPRDGSKIDNVDSSTSAAAPVLVVGLGRGFGGKSTGLAELAWRAKNAGRPIIIADGDARSRTLAALFPGEATVPRSEEPADVKVWLTDLLNRMLTERVSAALDLGGGDRILQEYGRDLKLVEFCQRRGIQPMAMYFLGPEPEDLNHVLSIWRAGYFRPKRALLVLNEGVIRDNATIAGAFERTMNDPGFAEMVDAGAVPMLMHRLACMNDARGSGVGFYAAAAGEPGADGIPLDPVRAFMLEDFLAELEKNRVDLGVAEWLP